METSTFTEQQVREKLMHDQRWLERAIVVLFEKNQTPDEQITEHTKYHNGIGFNGVDAKRLSYYAKWVNSGKHLSGRHLEKAFKTVPKYAGQILTIINHKN